MTLNDQAKRCGNFHTQANLSQALLAILKQHYSAINASPEGEVTPLPSFITEALQMVCHNLAGVINGQPYNPDGWKAISVYSEQVVDIITTAQQNAIRAASTEETSPKTAVSTSEEDEEGENTFVNDFINKP